MMSPSCDLRPGAVVGGRGGGAEAAGPPDGAAGQRELPGLQRVV